MEEGKKCEGMKCEGTPKPEDAAGTGTQTPA